MASDFQLDAMLEIDDSQVDDVNNELEATMSGGDSSPAQRDQQESVVAGGVSKGLLAAGVIAGILSQLKSITGIVNAVLGAISRSLVPIIEEVADIIRPFIETASSLAAAPGRAPEIVGGAIGGNTTEDLNRLGRIFGPSGLSNAERADELLQNPDLGPGFEQATDALIDSLFNSSTTADQTGEQSKQQVKDNVEDATKDKTGAFK